MAIQPVAADREERLTYGERAGIDGNARYGHGEVTHHERALGGVHDVSNGERRKASGYDDSSDKMRRATSRSSKGKTSEPTT